MEIQHASLDPGQDTPSFRRFQASQMARNRRLTDRGLGKWFGAFENDECVASMGMYVQAGLGRCQSIVTLPRQRRAGHCSTLLYEVCKYALAEMAAKEIVIRTGASNAAARVYRSIGFGAEESVASLSISGHRR